MRISAMNVRIMIQKNEVITDKIGNHRNEWSDYHSCYATTSTKTGEQEEETASQTVNKERLDFTVRYSSETAAITPDGFRILLGERIYNIISVDDMAFKHKSLKFHAELVRR